MIKSFMELYQLDISGYICQKPVFGKSAGGKGLDYLPWGPCVFLLHENGAEKVTYGNLYTSSGESLFLVDGKMPEVRVFVEIDGDRREISYPLINGVKAVKMEEADQLQIHKATQRAFVKCVAINWGLGLKLWDKEDREIEKHDGSDLGFHRLDKIKERFQKEYTMALKKGMSASDIAGKLQMSVEEVKAIFAYFDTLSRFEKMLESLTKAA